MGVEIARTHRWFDTPPLNLRSVMERLLRGDRESIAEANGSRRRRAAVRLVADARGLGPKRGAFNRSWKPRFIVVYGRQPRGELDGEERASSAPPMPLAVMYFDQAPKDAREPHKQKG